MPESKQNTNTLESRPSADEVVNALSALAGNGEGGKTPEPPQATLDRWRKSVPEMPQVTRGFANCIEH